MKVGKTTLASQMDRALLIAAEPGYHALPGVMAQDVTSWSEMRQVYRELKKPEVREMFRNVVCDTIDILADYCKKYICQQNGIEDLGELGYGRGWTKFKDEFNEVFRGLTQLGYGIYFIGHDKEVINDDGSKIIRPALSNSTRVIISGMADLYGYAHQKYAGEMSVLTLRCSDGSIECGGRFKYIDEEIPMNYHALVDAISRAIDKEAAETNGKFVTDERVESVPLEKTYDFDAMMNEFKTIVEKLMSENSSNALKITAITDKYLGKGKKVGDCTAEQCEQLELILIDLKDLLK